MLPPTPQDLRKAARRIGRHLDSFCTRLADGLGSNYTLFAFAVIAFVPFMYQMPHSVLEWQAWLSQTCIQLMALNVLQKGTKVEGNRTACILKDIHDHLHNKLEANHQEHMKAHREHMAAARKGN